MRQGNADIETPPTLGGGDFNLRAWESLSL